MSKLGNLILKAQYPTKKHWAKEMADVIDNMDCNPDLIMVCNAECVDHCLARGFAYGSVGAICLGAAAFVAVKVISKKKVKKEEETEEVEEA